MMKKCSGCGAIFQTTNPEKEGYVTQESYDEANICRRCFRIKNYGDYQIVDKNAENYQDIFNSIKKEEKLILFLCDILSLDESLCELNDFNGKIILVITKKDLLPKSVKEVKLLDYVNNNYDLNVCDVVFVSSTINYNLDVLMNLIDKHKVGNEVYLVGNTNAGKSTLINAFIKSYSKDKTYITTSSLPATTLDVISVKLDNDLTLIDTPGLVSNENYLTNVEASMVKKILPKKEIKPRTFQMKPNQALIVGDSYARIDYLGMRDNSFTIYLSNDIKVERININTNKRGRELKKYEFDISSNNDIVISGLLFCKIVKPAKVIIYTKENVKVFYRDNLI